MSDICSVKTVSGRTFEGTGYAIDPVTKTVVLKSIIILTIHYYHIFVSYFNQFTIYN